MTYVGRPILWSSTYAFEYPSVSPNIRGDLGISYNWGGGSFYPSHGVGLADSDSGGVLELHESAEGTNGPIDEAWGDYNRVKPFYPIGTTWVASGYTLQGGSTPNFVQPQFIMFGRERDNPIRLKGDVNDDGKITVADALLYLRYAVGQDISPYHIDPNSDDVTCEIPPVITVADALKVLRKAVGQNVSLEC